jgi:hypothetical protein
MIYANVGREQKYRPDPICTNVAQFLVDEVQAALDTEGKVPKKEVVELRKIANWDREMHRAGVDIDATGGQFVPRKGR